MFTAIKACQVQIVRKETIPIWTWVSALALVSLVQYSSSSGIDNTNAAQAEAKTMVLKTEVKLSERCQRVLSYCQQWGLCCKLSFLLLWLALDVFCIGRLSKRNLLESHMSTLYMSTLSRKWLCFWDIDRPSICLNNIFDLLFSIHNYFCQCFYEVQSVSDGH